MRARALLLSTLLTVTGLLGIAFEARAHGPRHAVARVAGPSTTGSIATYHTRLGPLGRAAWAAMVW